MSQRSKTPSCVQFIKGMEVVTSVSDKEVEWNVTWLIEMGKVVTLQTFYITALGVDHAILGYPWLREFNLWLDWKEARVLGPGIQIETCGLKKHHMAVLGRVLRVAREDPAWEEGDEVIIMAASTHTAQQWAIEVNK